MLGIIFCYLEYAGGVDIICHFNLRHASGCWWYASSIHIVELLLGEFPEMFVVICVHNANNFD